MVDQKDFAFYSTDISPTVDPANADPAPATLVILDQPPILGDGQYELLEGGKRRGSVHKTLGGAVVQDFGLVEKGEVISFSESDALSQDVVTALQVIHAVVGGQYYFTDGFRVWVVQFAPSNGFVPRLNLFWKQHDVTVYSYEINLIVISKEI